MTSYSDDVLANCVNDQIREPGDRWLEYGPKNYVPPVEVEVIEKIVEVALDLNEGIYVKDNNTGSVRLVSGETYMLKSHEELTEISLPDNVKKILTKENGCESDLTKVISYKIPYNCAVQIYDFRVKESRVMFGPDYIMLNPDESLTVNSLSGGKPKRPNVIQSIYIGLGPDFTSDVMEVETSDHARMSIALSYNWHFRLDKNNKESSEQIFAIKDFIGNLCSIMGAKIRAAVAVQTFDEFFKSFAKIIRTSVFGVNAAGKINNEYLIEKNNMVVSNIDITKIVPVDTKTRNSLKETVNLAIEITTKKQEEIARIVSENAKQNAKSELDNIKIENQLSAESKRSAFLAIESESKSIMDTGKANAEAEANAQASN